MLLIMTSVASGVEMYNTDPLYALWHLYVVGDVPPTAKSLFMRNQSFVMGAISTGDNRVFARNNTINSSWNSFNMGEVFGGPKRLGVQETILPLIFFQFGMWRLLVLLARRREESGPGVPDGGRAS
jgi:hypothetical protein